MSRPIFLNRMKVLLLSIAQKRNLPIFLALLGFVVYLAQSIYFAITQVSIVDEGAYLYQGLLFAKGIYHPFQVNGFWMYNSPVAYFIPGIFQAILHPGLLTGRIYAVGLSFLMLIGAWLTTRRISGKRWAAIVVWMLALGTAQIRIYSLALSEGLIACLLTWMLFLVLGERRSRAALIGGSLLASLIILTRHNLILLLPLLWIYIFWQHGRKNGFIAASAGLALLIVGYALYWPNILTIWVEWIPSGFLPFFDQFKSPATDALVQEVNLSGRLLAFFQAFRFQFISIVGSLIALLLISHKNKSDHPSIWRSSIFLSVLFFIQWLLHAWGSIGNTFCVFCLPIYTTFFSIAGILFIPVSYPLWRKTYTKFQNLLVALFLILICTGLGFSVFEEIGPNLLDIRIPRILTLFRSGEVEPGYPLWSILFQNFQLEFNDARKVVSAFAGMLIFFFIFLLFYLIWRLIRKRVQYGLVPFVLIAFFLTGTILSPVRLLSGGFQNYACNANTITAYQSIGEKLAGLIPAGSRVYWQNNGSSVPLLYLPDISIYPAQIYNRWSYSLDENDERVHRFGLWNDSLAEKWKQEVDFLLIEESALDQKWMDFFEFHPEIVELLPPLPELPCSQGSAIHIYTREITLP